MAPAAQAEAYYSEEERARIAMVKKLRCIECDHARAWCVGGTNMQTGYCTKHDMPLSNGQREHLPARCPVRLEQEPTAREVPSMRQGVRAAEQEQCLLLD